MAKTLAPPQEHAVGTRYVSNMWRRKSPLGRGETQRWEIAVTKESYPLGESAAQYVEARPPPPRNRGGEVNNIGTDEKISRIFKFLLSVG
jgi:hypothetical protein